MSDSFFKSLAPGSKTYLKDQFALAWQALGAASAPLADRLNARCWLTYRAIDGLVTFEDWQKHVMALELIGEIPANFLVRWRISQKTAECYLHILQGDFAKAMRVREAVAELFIKQGWHWPESILNYLRCELLHRYFCYLHPKAAETTANCSFKIIKEWNDFVLMGSNERPWQGYEINDAFQVFRASMVVDHAMGMLKLDPGVIMHPHRILNPASKSPFVRSALALGKIDPKKALWKHEGSLVDQYRIIHANKHYGPGGLTPQRVATIEKMVGSLRVDSVIDFGCGRSLDIAALWPHASHCYYDPAIPGMDTLPEHAFDLGYCTQVMEHIPEAELPEVLATMKALSPNWLLTIHTGLANQILPNGKNAHVTVKPESWWLAKFEAAFGVACQTEPMSPHCFYLATFR